MAVAATPDRATALPVRRRRLYLPRRARIALTIALGTQLGEPVGPHRPGMDRRSGGARVSAGRDCDRRGSGDRPRLSERPASGERAPRRPKPLPPYPPVGPAVTVLIAAYNEEDGIEQTIAAILAQDYAGAVSVLVIDDGSSDGTRDVVRCLAEPDEHVSLIEAEHGGKAAALNLGLACARRRSSRRSMRTRCSSRRRCAASSRDSSSIPKARLRSRARCSFGTAAAGSWRGCRSGTINWESRP